MSNQTAEKTPFSILENERIYHLQFPDALRDARISQLYGMMADCVPLRFISVGFNNALINMQPDRQRLAVFNQDRETPLDMDLFLPYRCSTEASWADIWRSSSDYGEPRQAKYLPGTQDIVHFWGGVNISPRLSREEPQLIQTEITKAFCRLLPDNWTHVKTTKAGEPLIIVGDNAAVWGQNRRHQVADSAQPFLEIVPLCLGNHDLKGIKGQDEFQQEMARIGYPLDAYISSGVFYRPEWDKDNPDFLNFRCDKNVHWNDRGLNSPNWEYIDNSPQSALNWLRREMKAIVYWSLSFIDFDDYNRFIKQQTKLLDKHIFNFYKRIPDIASPRYTSYIDKINDYYTRLKPILTDRGIKVHDSLIDFNKLNSYKNAPVSQGV